MEDHVHCCACGRPIATSKKSPSGKRVEVEINLVASPLAVPGPDERVHFVAETRPACADCLAEITAKQAMAEARKAASRLVVARPGIVH